MDNFDLMAKDYDTDIRVERAKAIADEIRLHVRGGKMKSAIEYGCGTGLVGFHLINDFGSLLFADSSREMTEQVNKKLAAAGKPETSAVCIDFMTNVTHGLRADYIFTSLVLHHIKDTEIILSRFYNILNDNGRILIVDLDRDDGSFHAKYPGFDGYNGFIHEDLAETVRKAGFVNAATKTFYHNNKTVNGKESRYSLFILDAEKHKEVYA